MTGQPAAHRLQGWSTDPLAPLAVLAAMAVAVATAGIDPLTWAAAGGLAGYSLSGSV